MEQKICESCGMPMRKESEFGGGKINNRYCCYCTDKEGNLKSFDDALNGMKEFIMKTYDIHAEEAIKMAKENMSVMPAWTSKFKKQ